MGKVAWKVIDWAVKYGSFAGFLVGVGAMAHIACSPTLEKQIVKSAIDVALAACIAENPGNDMKALQEICHFTDELAPAVEELLAAQKRGMNKGKCEPTVTKVTPADGGK